MTATDEPRELVRAACKCIHSGLSCYDCRLIAGGCTLQSAMRELAKELYKLADRGLMELDDDNFRRIVEEAEELGVTDWPDEMRALGRRTCHVMTIGEFNGESTEYYDVCSNCGYEFDDDPLNYCPNCGRRIEVTDG